MIGSLRERLTLLSPQRVPDGAGGYNINFTERATVAGRSTDLSGRRVRFTDRELPVRRRRFTFRHRDDLVFEMRVRHDAQIYRITDIQEDDQRRFHTVTAEEIRP